MRFNPSIFGVAKGDLDDLLDPHIVPYPSLSVVVIRESRVFVTEAFLLMVTSCIDRLLDCGSVCSAKQQ